MNGKQCCEANKNNICSIFRYVQVSALMMIHPLVEHISHALIDVRDYSVGHSSAVRVPGQSVFGSALFLISGLSVDEQDGEIDDIEVR